MTKERLEKAIENSSYVLLSKNVRSPKIGSVVCYYPMENVTFNNKDVDFKFGFVVNRYDTTSKINISVLESNEETPLSYKKEIHHLSSVPKDKEGVPIESFWEYNPF